MPTETTDPSLQDPTPAAPKNDFAATVLDAAQTPPAPLPAAALIPLAGLSEMPAIIEAAALALRHFRLGGATLTRDDCDRIQLAAAQISNYAGEMTPDEA